MTKDKDVAEKQRNESQKSAPAPVAANDLILPKLESLATKIEHLEKVENERNSKDDTKKKEQGDFDKNKIVEVEKLAESMQAMINQAQKQRKELDSQKETPPSLTQKPKTDNAKS